MRIDNGINSATPLAGKNLSKAAPKSGGAKSAGQVGAASSNSVDNLLKLVSDSTEIRESLVNDIKLKIQTGEYLAQQSAVETASSILNL